MVKFFGVRIDTFNRLQTVELLSKFLNSNHTNFVTTPNPEILIEAQYNSAFMEVLAKADLGVIDGFGLFVMLRLKGVKTERFTGVDMVEELAKMCAGGGKKMMLLGGENTTTAMRILKEKFLKLQISSKICPNVLNDGSEVVGDCDVVPPRNDVGLYTPDVLLVGFGAPKQELWISKYFHEFPSVRIVAGVGGAFDMIAGAKPRAPFIFRRIGLEWLWRLFLEPKRFRRIFRAVVVFPIRAIFEKVTYN